MMTNDAYYYISFWLPTPVVNPTEDDELPTLTYPKYKKRVHCPVLRQNRYQNTHQKRRFWDGN